MQVFYFLFYFFERCSVFWWIRFVGKKKSENKEKKPFVMTYIFPELWVVGNILFAILSEKIVYIIECKWVIWILVIYSVERVFEMFVYQMNVLFFHPLRAEYLHKEKKVEKYAIKSATRTVLMLILNMIEYILQFAVIFTAVRNLSGLSSDYVGIAGSFKVFMNITSPEEFSDNCILMLAYVETVIGLFMNIICLARFVGMLPEVAQKDSV